MTTDELTTGYAEALFTVVKAEGDLERVEDELYRFGKLLESNNDLKQALSEPNVDLSQRVKVLEDLLAGKVSPHTLGLITFVVAQERGRQLTQILEELSELAAEARKSVVAEVRSATPLDNKQRNALARALGEATGKKVEVKVLVDPSIIGGVVAKIGDTVIDGSVRRRLQQLREQVKA
ncbi:MAG: ATP synthase F1 subunit delta [Actinomycetota bacterium]